MLACPWDGFQEWDHSSICLRVIFYERFDDFRPCRAEGAALSKSDICALLWVVQIHFWLSMLGWPGAVKRVREQPMKLPMFKWRNEIQSITKSSGRCAWVWCSALWDVLPDLGWWSAAQLYSWCVSTTHDGICREMLPCRQPVIKQHIFHGDQLPLNTALNIFFRYLVSHFVGLLVFFFYFTLCWHSGFYTVTFKGAFCKGLWKNCSTKMLSPNSFLASFCHIWMRERKEL